MNLPPVLRQRFFDSNGTPLAGGKVYTYAAGTSTQQATYTDQTGGAPNANPLVLDANGEAAMWLDPALSYKFVLKDSNDVPQWTVDNVIGILTPDAVNTDSIQDGAVTLEKLSDTLGENEILGANAAGTELEAKALTAGPNITITHSVGGIEIEAAGSSDRLVQRLDQYDSGIQAGEALSSTDAICLDLNFDTYKFFKCDADIATRRLNFMGFSTADATVTAHIQTYTIDSALVSGNKISLSINGRSYPNTSFATDSDTTLASLATLIATDPDVSTAMVTSVGGGTSNDRVITVTGRNGLTINITSVVTGGASQAAVTLADTQAGSGDTVKCHAYGPLGGFTGLTQGAKYYLSSTAGAITTSPTEANPILAGQALSSTVLFVFINESLQFGTSSIFVRSHGGSTGETLSDGQLDVEHFDYTSWSAGFADSNARSLMHTGDAQVGGFMLAVDGSDTSSTVSSLTRLYNKVSWASASGNRTTARTSCGCSKLSNKYYSGFGSTVNDYGAGTAKLESFDGTSWSNLTDLTATATTSPSCFMQGSKVHWVGGMKTDGSGALNQHISYNGASGSSETAWPTTAAGCSGFSSPSSGGVGISASGSFSYVWSGSSWGSNIAVGYTTSPTNFKNVGPAGGYNSGSDVSYMNGGSSDSSTSINTSVKFNGSSYLSESASTNSRAGSTGAIY